MRRESERQKEWKEGSLDGRISHWEMFGMFSTEFNMRLSSLKERVKMSKSGKKKKEIKKETLVCFWMKPEAEMRNIVEKKNHEKKQKETQD